MQIDVAAVQDGASRFGPAGADLGAAVQALRSAVTAAGSCWGTDESGAQFARDYLPAAQAALQAFDQLTGKVHSMRAALGVTATGFAGYDADGGRDLTGQQV